jgi:hypothetical protein
MKRLAFAIGGLVGAAAVATTLLVATASGRSSAGITFRLIEKDQAFNFVDNPPTSRMHVASIGDAFTFKAALLSRSMKKSGTLVATCTVTSGGRRPTETCYGTCMLKGGQLVGVTSIREGQAANRIAIVGGTGSYVGARGEVMSVSRGENSPFSDDTVHLLP